MASKITCDEALSSFIFFLDYAKAHKFPDQIEKYAVDSFPAYVCSRNVHRAFEEVSICFKANEDNIRNCDAIVDKFIQDHTSPHIVSLAELAQERFKRSL